MWYSQASSHARWGFEKHIPSIAPEDSPCPGALAQQLLHNFSYDIITSELFLKDLGAQIIL